MATPMTPTSRALPVRAAYESGTAENWNAAASTVEMRQPPIRCCLSASKPAARRAARHFALAKCAERMYSERMADEITLGEEIAALATQMNVATHRLLTCVRKLDESEGRHDGD